MPLERYDEPRTAIGSTAVSGLSWPLALRLGRVSNLPTVWTNVLAGAVLSGASLTAGQVFALMLAVSLFYVAGMCLNDAFDADYDRQYRPWRPIPSGALAASTVFGFGAVLVGAALILLLVLGFAPGGHGWRGFAGGVALTAAILAYDAWHKGNPIGPVLMGLCRVLVYVTAAAAIAGTLPRDLFWAAAMALCYLIGLTYAAKQEDLKQPGHLWPLIFLAAPFVYGLPIAAGFGVGSPIYVALLATVLYALSLMARRGRANIPRVVSVLIAGICLLDALFIAGAGQPLLATLAVLGFPLTLLFQRSIPGT
jgi:4-hydroxybenzoate polyprenyltransferase